MSAANNLFECFPIVELNSDTLDDALAESDRDIDILFLWGPDCPNCDIAKRSILLAPELFQWPRVRWLHGNVYADAAIGVRFGLHGIPAFIVFHRGCKIGRISPFPGTEPFVAAIDAQIAKLGG